MLWYMLLLTVTLLSFSSILYGSFSKMLYGSLDDLLSSRSEGVANSISAYWAAKAVDIQHDRQSVNDFVKNGVSENEVEEAKGFLKGTFPTTIETPEKLAHILLAYRVYGVEDSYLTTFVSRLNKLNKSDIDRVIKKYYTPQNYQIFVYGPKAPVLEQLRPLGAVEAKPFAELL